MQTLEEIRAKLKHGDYTRIGEALSMTRMHAYMTLQRPKAKRHQEALAVARQIVDFYESLSTHE